MEARSVRQLALLNSGLPLSPDSLCLRRSVASHLEAKILLRGEVVSPVSYLYVYVITNIKVTARKRANKILRFDDPSFEDEINNILLASVDCKNENNIDDCLESEADFVNYHKRDQEDDEEISNPDSLQDNQSR
ncbi:unnamed protein product [Euphydryas editha]|uniref:Uncharacterized protein n=1 Tax=Euphydryas editha TaxID=104508 RepID=A0AAU9TED8_EUPED|nr:unnamed protein product [Euphydryas editha]